MEPRIFTKASNPNAKIRGVKNRGSPGTGEPADDF